jgi:uracil-DNA glycosylase family 4
VPRAASAPVVPTVPVAAPPGPEPAAEPMSSAPFPERVATPVPPVAARAPVVAPVSPVSPAATAARAPSAGPDDDRAERLQRLREEVLPCTRCKLSQGRQHVVFGEGNPRARVLFVGEAPGANEDRTGRPFVGDAGQLLDRIISGAMGLQRSDVFIANINKCRPPGNREPEPDEVAACLPFLRAQIEILRPEVIVCLGRVAAQNLLGRTESASKLRGQQLDYLGIPVVVTWHPAYLLRDPSHKRETWDDIKRVNRLLGLPEVPGGSAS